MPTQTGLPTPRRGDVWLVELDKVRPAVVLTRDPMGRYLRRIIVGPITSTVRGLETEVAVGPADGLRRVSVVNLDNSQLIQRTKLRRRVGRVQESTMLAICLATAYAIGCRR